MIKILDNFPELLISTKLDEHTFNDSVKISYLDNSDLKELDKCIEKILKIYPKLYPQISDSTQNKHRYDKIERENKKYEEIFIRHINEKSFRLAAKIFSMMSHIRINIEDSNQLFDDTKYADLFHDLSNEIAHLKTKDEIKKEIKEYLENCINDMIADKKTLDILATYIIDEISLRVHVPEEYDLEENCTQCELLFDKLEILERKKYLDEIIQLNKEQKSASEILQTLKLKYKIGNITNKLL